MKFNNLRFRFFLLKTFSRDSNLLTTTHNGALQESSTRWSKLSSVVKSSPAIPVDEDEQQFYARLSVYAPSNFHWSLRFARSTVAGDHERV